MPIKPKRIRLFALILQGIIVYRNAFIADQKADRYGFPDADYIALVQYSERMKKKRIRIGTEART